MKLLTHESQWHGGQTVVAFGMFDGVHEGHAKLMRSAAEIAALQGLTSMVYTFSTHPMATYAPDRVPPQLETRSEKVCSIAVSYTHLEHHHQGGCAGLGGGRQAVA